jgi:hypothetical protein
VSQPKTGPSRTHTRVSIIAIFGALFFGIALVAALPGRATSAGKSNPASPNETCWRVIAGANPKYTNELYGVAVLSSNDAWAVGSSGETLAEHWDGTTWSEVPTPHIAALVSRLSGVAAVTTNDVWAVGYYSSDGTVNQTLVEHWNGSIWSVVPNPNPGTGENNLNGVAALSANDVWAVGDYSNIGGFHRTLVEHWNGSVWSVVGSPNPGASDNWLNGVAAVAANDVWAVGYYSGHTLVEHWDSTTWSVVPSPDRDLGDSLDGVAAISANDVWAVGTSVTQSGGIIIVETLVEHWNGLIWSVVDSPNPDRNPSNPYNRLYGVAAVAANDVWAVGSYGQAPHGNEFTLVEHWDGSLWSVVDSPNSGRIDNELDGVAALSASEVWAVGTYGSRRSGLDWTLLVRYNQYAPCATPPTATNTPGSPTPNGTPSGTPTSCSIQFSDVPSGSTFYPYIQCLACRGIIGGYPDGTFKPNNRITRGQLAKIVSSAAGFSDTQTVQMFQDVPVGSTFFQYIGRLASRGYMSGYACGGANEPCIPPGNLPYFRPGNNATRGQISKIDSYTAGFFDTPSGQQFEDVAAGSIYYTYTYRLVSHSIMSGYPCGGVGEACNPPGNLPYFRPNNNATRGQTSKIVSNTFFPGCQTPEDAGK